MLEPHKVNPKTFAKLFAATDTLRRLKSDTDRLTVQRYGSALAQMCDSLADALNKDLERLIYDARDAVNPEEKNLARGIVQDAQSFAAFLRFERDALVACGVSEGAAQDTISAIQELRDRFDNYQYIPEEIAAAVKRTKDEVCDSAAQARTRLDKKQASRQLRRNALLASGVAVTLATITAATGGIALVIPAGYLTVSSAFGGLLVTTGNLQKDPGDKPIKPKK